MKSNQKMTLESTLLYIILEEESHKQWYENFVKQTYDFNGSESYFFLGTLANFPNGNEVVRSVSSPRGQFVTMCAKMV